MMTVARLHELFESHPDKAMLGFEGQCHDCGKDVNVAVALTPEGFSISGGAVYEPEPDKFHNKCDDCHRKSPHLSLRARTRQVPQQMRRLPPQEPAPIQLPPV